MAATRRPVQISLKHCGSNLISSKRVNIFVSAKKRAASPKGGDIAFPCDELVQGFSNSRMSLMMNAWQLTISARSPPAEPENERAVALR